MHLLKESALWETVSEFFTPDGNSTEARGETEIIVTGDKIKNFSWVMLDGRKIENRYVVTMRSENHYTFESENPGLGTQVGTFSINSGYEEGKVYTLTFGYQPEHWSGNRYSSIVNNHHRSLLPPRSAALPLFHSLQNPVMVSVPGEARSQIRLTGGHGAQTETFADRGDRLGDEGFVHSFFLSQRSVISLTGGNCTLSVFLPCFGMQNVIS